MILDQVNVKRRRLLITASFPVQALGVNLSLTDRKSRPQSDSILNHNMDQNLARRTLQELIKREDLKNKSCVDCGNPNPQWASLRFAPYPFSHSHANTPRSASPYLFASNAPDFTEVSACTSGGLNYVISFNFLSEYPVLSAPYQWIHGRKIKFGE